MNPFAVGASVAAPAVWTLRHNRSAGDIFGATYDQLADRHRLVVPDLLGFGRSIGHNRELFPAEAHLDALDELADCTGLFDRR